MEKRNKILALVLTLIIILTSFLIINTPLHKQTIPARFIAGENMGFDLSPGNLNFGKIVPGYSASRDTTITNTYQYPTLTKIKSSGKISPYIIVSENNFHLNPNESKNITFSCFPEIGIELKEYAGQITIITNKA